MTNPIAKKVLWLLVIIILIFCLGMVFLIMSRDRGLTGLLSGRASVTNFQAPAALDPACGSICSTSCSDFSGADSNACLQSCWQLCQQNY